MSAGTGPVAADEFVLRRIHKNHVTAGPPTFIGFTGFRPTAEDTAGLSVYREQLVSATQVLNSGRKPGEYYVIRFSVATLEALGLSVAPDESSGLAGHALIPELSLGACKVDKFRTREIQVRLSELASRNIVATPNA